MAKRGRPTLYRPEYPELARKACLLGADNQKLARFFEVADTTIDKWLAEIPEFSGAVKAGREVADQTVAASLYHRACGYSHKAVKIFMPAGASAPVYAEYVEHYPPDPTSAIFWLKNRDPERWREKSDINIKVKDVRDLSIDQILQAIALERAAGAQDCSDELPSVH